MNCKRSLHEGANQLCRFEYTAPSASRPSRGRRAKPVCHSEAPRGACRRGIPHLTQTTAKRSVGGRRAKPAFKLPRDCKRKTSRAIKIAHTTSAKRVIGGEIHPKAEQSVFYQASPHAQTVGAILIARRNVSLRCRLRFSRILIRRFRASHRDEHCLSANSRRSAVFLSS